MIRLFVGFICLIVNIVFARIFITRINNKLNYFRFIIEKIEKRKYQRLNLSICNKIF